MIIEIETYEGEPLGFEFPDSCVLEIVEAEPVVKGQTATTSYKPAILENGVKIMVPRTWDRARRSSSGSRTAPTSNVSRADFHMPSHSALMNVMLRA